MSKPTIFFDVGGVLVKRNTTDASRISRILGVSELAYKEAHKETIEVMDTKEPGVFWSLRTLYDEIAHLNRFHRVLTSLLSLSVTEDVIEACTRERTQSDFSLLKDVPVTLRALSTDYNLAIISNALPSRRFHELRFQNIDQYFYPIVISTEVGINKPAHKLFEFALDLACVKAQDSYFVDDNIENIQAALEIGFKKVFYISSAVTEYQHERMMKCTHIADIHNLIRQ